MCKNAHHHRCNETRQGNGRRTEREHQPLVGTAVRPYQAWYVRAHQPRESERCNRPGREQRYLCNRCCRRVPARNLSAEPVPCEYDIDGRKDPVARERRAGQSGVTPNKASRSRAASGRGAFAPGLRQPERPSVGGRTQTADQHFGMPEHLAQADKHDDGGNDLTPDHRHEGAFKASAVADQEDADNDPHHHPCDQAGCQQPQPPLAYQHALGDDADTHGQGVRPEQESARDRGQVEEPFDKRRQGEQDRADPGAQQARVDEERPGSDRQRRARLARGLRRGPGPPAERWPALRTAALSQRVPRARRRWPGWPNTL